MISLQTSVDLSKYTPRAAQILSMLGPAAKKEMHDAAATETVELLRRHIRKYAEQHHASADEIRGGPARRTGHLEKAAEGVEKGSVTSDSSTVNVRSPGFRRALGPLTILPKTKPYLTIPVHAIAYGNTVADLVADGLKIFRPKGRDFLATTRKTSEGPKLLVLYALKTSATLKHAPDMLPSGDEFKTTARDAIIGVIQMRLQNRGAA